MPSLARRRLAVAAAFGTQGFVFIGLTTRLPDIKDRWDLSELGISGVLLAIVLLAGAGSVSAETLSRRTASARLLRAGLLVIAAGAGLMLAAPAWPVFLAGVASYGVGLGVVDASTNMQAVALERRYGRPILPSFHGGWTAGGVLGASVTLATADVPLRWTALVVVLPLAMAAAPYLPRDPAAPATDELPDPALVAAVPWQPIVMVGLGMVVFYMVETAVQTWGAVYLDDVVDAPSRWVALAALPYLLAALVVRLSGDRLVQRYGATLVLRVGAVLACAGLLVVTTAPTWPVAVLGFTVVGAVSVTAPLSFSAAATIAGGSTERVDAVIARFNQFNYAGGLLGAVLTGVVGQDQLRLGFVVPMVLVLALLPLARWFRTVG